MADCEMTCRAGMRVLYDLAGGSRKRWAGLDEDLRATPGTAKRVFARNDNWPQQFGAVNYKDLVARYALDEFSTLYGALVTIKETLRAYDAYTPEVQAVVAGIDAESDEAAIEACLDRLSDVIYATARPASRAVARSTARPSQPEGNRRADESARSVAGEPNTLPAAEKVVTGSFGDCADPSAGNVRVVGRAGQRGPVAGPGVPAARGEGAGPSVGQASPCGTPEATAPVGDGGSPEGEGPREPSFSDLRVLLCTGPRRVLLRTFADDDELLAELLPPDVLADVHAGRAAGAPAAFPSPTARDELALRLCSDGGMACREIIRRCERLLRAADRDAFAAGVADLEARRGLRADVAAGHTCPGASAEPDYLAEPLGYLAVRFSCDPARRLFALTLLALLGRSGAAAVLRRLRDDPALCAGNL